MEIKAQIDPHVNSAWKAFAHFLTNVRHFPSTNPHFSSNISLFEISKFLRRFYNL